MRYLGQDRWLQQREGFWSVDACLIFGAVFYLAQPLTKELVGKWVGREVK